jgi:ribonuclease G
MTSVNEILINASLHETRVAYLEDGALVEIYVEREGQQSCVGNIYKGKVVRVLPGMQAAFIDIGLEKNGFLHIKDIHSSNQKVMPSDDHKAIDKLLHEGQMVWVQASKDPLGDKGVRLTTELTLSSPNFVYIPNGEQIAISQKLEDQSERIRLQEFLEEFIRKNTLTGGFIIRTLANQATDVDLQLDLQALMAIWSEVRETLIHSSSIIQAFEQPSLALRVIRDFASEPISKITFDHQEPYDEAVKFVRKTAPHLLERIEVYRDKQPLFSHFQVDQKIENALLPTVELPSGGAVVIQQTEALVSIDVNTASFVGVRGMRSTILQNNLEAAIEVANQVRLRNLGGIILVDFIDMERLADRKKLFATLEEALAKDQAYTQVGQISNLGLIEISRQRSRQSLTQAMCEPCKVCQGTGSVKTNDSICYEILREIIGHDRHKHAKAYTILTTQNIVDSFKSGRVPALEKLQSSIGCPISLKVDKFLQHNEYEIALS